MKMKLHLCAHEILEHSHSIVNKAENRYLLLSYCLYFIEIKLNEDLRSGLC